MGEYKDKLKRQRHEFLLTFFADQEYDHYDKRIVNGFVLVKQWNGNSKNWEVAIYTKENFIRTKSGGKVGQTSPKPSDKQWNFLNDGGGQKSLQEPTERIGSNPLPWETEGDK